MYMSCASVFVHLEVDLRKHAITVLIASLSLVWIAVHTVLSYLSRDIASSERDSDD